MNSKDFLFTVDYDNREFIIIEREFWEENQFLPEDEVDPDDCFADFFKVNTSCRYTWTDGNSMDMGLDWLLENEFEQCNEILEILDFDEHNRAGCDDFFEREEDY